MYLKTEDLLQDILDEIKIIEMSINEMEEYSFYQNIILKRAVERSLLIIGEAVSKLPQTFKESNSQIEWKEISDMRNLIVHHYRKTDYTIVWSIIKTEIPELKTKVEDILRQNK